MRENHAPLHEPIGVSRNVIKTTPKRVTALWLFGTFIIISSAFIGVQIGIFLNNGLTEMAYWDALFFVLGIGSVIGFLTIILQESAQDLHIKIVKEK